MRSIWVFVLFWQKIWHWKLKSRAILTSVICVCNILHNVASGFRRHVDEICTLLGYYTALSGNSAQMFRDNLSVPSSRVKKSKNFFLGLLDWRFITTYRSHLQRSRRTRTFFLYSTSWPLKLGPIRCPETSVKNYHSTLRNIPEERSWLLHSTFSC